MKRLGISAGLLAAAQILSQLIGLAVLILVSRRIGPAYLGAYAFSYNIVAYVGLATTVGLPVLGLRDVGQSQSSKSRVLVETVTARVTLALLLGALLIAIPPWITSSPASRILMPILAIKLLIDARTVDWYLQGIERNAGVAASRVLGQIAYAAVMLPLLAVGLTGAKHYAIANLAGLAVTTLIMLGLVLRHLDSPISRVRMTHMRQRITRSLPFLSWIALTQVYYTTDLILVAYLAGDRQAGLYTAASKLPISVIGVASLWFTVAMPTTARLYSSAQTDLIGRQTRTAATAAVVAGLPFILLGPIFANNIISALFGPRFTGAGPTLAILSVSVAVSLLQIVVTSVVMGAGRERPYVQAMTIGVIANVILNLLLIPQIGTVGAAISTIVSESLVLVAGIVQIQYVIGPLKLVWRPVGESVVTVSAAAAVAILIRHEAGFYAGALGAISVCTAVIAVRTTRDPQWLHTWMGNAS